MSLQNILEHQLQLRKTQPRTPRLLLEDLGAMAEDVLFWKPVSKAPGEGPPTEPQPSGCAKPGWCLNPSAEHQTIISKHVHKMDENDSSFNPATRFLVG